MEDDKTLPLRKPDGLDENIEKDVKNVRRSVEEHPAAGVVILPRTDTTTPTDPSNIPDPDIESPTEVND